MPMVKLSQAYGEHARHDIGELVISLREMFPLESLSYACHDVIVETATAATSRWMSCAADMASRSVHTSAAEVPAAFGELAASSRDLRRVPYLSRAYAHLRSC